MHIPRRQKVRSCNLVYVVYLDLFAEEHVHRMTATDVLFCPFGIGAVELANRIVMVPMTRSMAIEGIPGSACG